MNSLLVSRTPAAQRRNSTLLQVELAMQFFGGELFLVPAHWLLCQITFSFLPRTPDLGFARGQIFKCSSDIPCAALFSLCLLLFSALEICC